MTHSQTSSFLPTLVGVYFLSLILYILLLTKIL